MAVAIKALPAALLGSFSRLGLARRRWLRLQGRLREAEALKALLAARACGVCGCVKGRPIVTVTWSNFSRLRLALRCWLRLRAAFACGVCDCDC